jgi:D-proline reductase (dithiol) PrdB
MHNASISFSATVKPVKASRVALVSTAGVRTKSDKAFDIHAAQGDWSFRTIPNVATGPDLAIDHTHYPHHDADRDPNCVFPIDRARELVADELVGSIAETHYGLMGFVPEAKHLIEETGPQLAELLRADSVDIVVLTPG